jgi:signal transduction histidine kinase
MPDDLAMLLHDLRSPLATVAVYTQLLLRDASTYEHPAPGLDEKLRTIQEATLRIEHLVDRLAGKPRASSQTTIDLVELTKRVAASVPHVTVFSEMHEIPGNWDMTGLERVLSNLIENARKYSAPDQPVLVTLRSTRRWAIVRVADRGIGIPAADLARVLERGFRAANTNNQHGLGLGLAAVKNIVRAHGGAISVESREGVGTTVTVRLPLQLNKPEEMPS